MAQLARAPRTPPSHRYRALTIGEPLRACAAEAVIFPVQQRGVLLARRRTSGPPGSPDMILGVVTTDLDRCATRIGYLIRVTLPCGDT